MTIEEIHAGMRLDGIVAGATVEVLAVQPAGSTSATVTYKAPDGGLGQKIVTADDLAAIEQPSPQRWGFNADPAMFKLAAEARRMKWAHLSDPFAGVDTSNIEPYPHQIDAVYNRFLEQRPLRFLALRDERGGGGV